MILTPGSYDSGVLYQEELNLEFIYEPELLEYMKAKGRYDIIVELVSIDHSDIEMTDLHVFLANKRQMKLFKEEKKYKCIRTSVGEVLMPVYKFDMDEDEKIVFGLKSTWIFKTITYRGFAYKCESRFTLLSALSPFYGCAVLS